MKMMTKGYVVRLVDLLETKGVVVQLFNGQRWEINKEKAQRFSTFYEGGKPYEVIFAERPTEELFNQIKLVLDKKGSILARRIQKNLPLKTIKVNDVFRYKIADPKKAALKIYQAIEEQEDQEFARQMIMHWYSNHSDELIKK